MSPQSPWANFAYSELKCQCGQCGSDGTEMDILFMNKVQRLRTYLGFALPVNSAYRCPLHPIEAAKDEPGVHTFGHGIDIRIHRGNAYLLMEAVFGQFKRQFTGIGWRQHGNTRFIHLDDFNGPNILRPTIWSYPK